MSDLNWRVLTVDEWDKLEVFLRANVGDHVNIPDPVFTSVLVLENAGAIVAAIPCGFQLMLGDVITSPAVPPDLIDPVYVSGVVAVRHEIMEKGGAGMTVFALNDPDKAALMAAVGFVEVTDSVPFMGVA